MGLNLMGGGPPVAATAPPPMMNTAMGASFGVVAASPPPPATAVLIGGDPFLKVLMDLAQPLAPDSAEIKLYFQPTTGALRNLSLQLEPPPGLRAVLSAQPPAAVAGPRVTIPMLSPGGATPVSVHVACTATPGGAEMVLLAQVSYSDVASVVAPPSVVAFRCPVALAALLRPRAITTPEFGQNWPLHAAESKNSAVCAAAADPNQFMALLQKGLHIAPVQIIGFECIACGMVLGSNDTILVHAKLSRSAAGPMVELTVRSKNPGLTQALQRAALTILNTPM
jgi:hypothetical protein